MGLGSIALEDAGMSRGRRARARQHRPPPAPSADAETSRHDARHTARKARLLAAERRAGLAKAALGTCGAIIFGAAMVFARHSYAGHAKDPSRPLTAPPRFVSIVRRNLLQAGIVAPAQAPPGASTAAS
jgi:hypothetical protein